jgi:hypothetical protein
MGSDPNNSPTGRLYRWDLLSAHVGVGNISLGLNSGDVISPVGFAKLYHGSIYFGLVVSQSPGSSSVVATLIDAGDAVSGRHKFQITCQSLVSMDLPTAYAPMGGRSRILFAGDDQFTLIDVPLPTASRSDKRTVAHANKTTIAAPLGQCPAFTFGLPPTCSACTPPTAVCGMTEHCTSGCCFVSGGRVLCCTQSPPGTTSNGFSCARNEKKRVSETKNDEQLE